MLSQNFAAETEATTSGVFLADRVQCEIITEQTILLHAAQVNVARRRKRSESPLLDILSPEALSKQFIELFSV